MSMQRNASVFQSAGKLEFSLLVCSVEYFVVAKTKTSCKKYKTWFSNACFDVLNILVFGKDIGFFSSLVLFMSFSSFLILCFSKTFYLYYQLGKINLIIIGKRC